MLVFAALVTPARASPEIVGERIWFSGSGFAQANAQYPAGAIYRAGGRWSFEFKAAADRIPVPDVVRVRSSLKTSLTEPAGAPPGFNSCRAPLRFPGVTAQANLLTIWTATLGSDILVYATAPILSRLDGCFGAGMDYVFIPPGTNPQTGVRVTLRLHPGRNRSSRTAKVAFAGVHWEGRLTVEVNARRSP